MNLTNGPSVIVESLRVIFLAVESISLLLEAFSLTGEWGNTNKVKEEQILYTRMTYMIYYRGIQLFSI